MDSVEDENPSVPFEEIDLNGLKDIAFDAFGRVVFSELSREDQELTDISFVTSFPSVSRVNLAKNHVEDLFPLQHLESLKYLNISHNAVSDLGSLGVPLLLQELNASNNALKSLSPNVPHMESLRQLSLENNALEELDIHSLPLLSQLNVSFNTLTSLTNIQDLPELSTLNASHNKVTAPSFSPLPSLTTLDLSNNPIISLNDISAATLPSLTSVSLAHTHIHSFASIAPLTRLRTLSSLSLANTPISRTPRYRTKLIALFLSTNTVLAHLDDTPVTPAELNAAQTLLPGYSATTAAAEGADIDTADVPESAPIPHASVLRASERAVTATWLRTWDLMRGLNSLSSRENSQAALGSTSSLALASASSASREGFTLSLAQLSLSSHAFDAATATHARAQNTAASQSSLAIDGPVMTSLDLSRSTQALAHSRPRPLPHAHTGLAALLLASARECAAAAQGNASQNVNQSSRYRAQLPPPTATPASLLTPLSFSALHTLSLSHCQLGPTSPVIPALATFIASAPSLSVLVLSHNHLGSHLVKTGVIASRCPALRALVPAAAVHGLASLDLSHNNIDDEGGEAISMLVGSDRDPPLKTLRRLSLSHNPLGTRTALALSHALAAPAGLRALELAVIDASSSSSYTSPNDAATHDARPKPSCAPLSAAAVELLLQGVIRCPLVELDLSGQPLSDTAAHLLALALNPPQDADMVSSTHGAHTQTQALKNPDVPAPLPTTPLLRSPAISTLALAHCGVSPLGLYALAAAIATAPSQPLLDLDVTDNMPGADAVDADAALAALFRASIRAESLRDLRVDGLPLGPHSLLALAALTARHRSLASLSVLAPSQVDLPSEKYSPEFAAVVLRPEVASQAARIASLLGDTGLTAVAVAQKQLPLISARELCDAWRPRNGPYTSCRSNLSNHQTLGSPTNDTTRSIGNGNDSAVAGMSLNVNAPQSQDITQYPPQLRGVAEIAQFRQLSLPATMAQVKAAQLHSMKVRGPQAIETDTYARAALSLSEGASVLLVFRGHRAHDVLAAALGDIQDCPRCTQHNDATLSITDALILPLDHNSRGCTPQCIRERHLASTRSWRALAAGASGQPSHPPIAPSPWPLPGLRSLVGRDDARCGILLSRGSHEALRWATLFNPDWTALEALVEVDRERVPSEFYPLASQDAVEEDATEDVAGEADAENESSSSTRKPYELITSTAAGVDPFDPASPPHVPLAGPLLPEVAPVALLPLLQALQASHASPSTLEYHEAQLCNRDALMDAVCAPGLAPLHALRLGGVDAYLPLLLQAMLTHPLEGAHPRNIVSPCASATPTAGTLSRFAHLHELTFGENVQWTVSGWRALCCLVATAPLERLEMPGAVVPGTDVVAIVDGQMLVRVGETGEEMLISEHDVNEAIAASVRALLRAAVTAPTPYRPPTDSATAPVDEETHTETDVTPVPEAEEPAAAAHKMMSISLRGTLLGDSGAWAIAQHFAYAQSAQAPPLIGLDLSGCGLGLSFRALIESEDEDANATVSSASSAVLPGVTALSQALARYPTCGAVTLDLSDNGLEASALAVLARGLAANTVSRKVILTGNVVAYSTELVDALATLVGAHVVSLSLPTVIVDTAQRLELSRRLFAAAAKNTKLEVIELGGTYTHGLWLEEAQMLLATVQTPGNKLKCVTIDRVAVSVAFTEAGEGGEVLETEGEWALDSAMGYMAAQRVSSLGEELSFSI